MNSCNFRKQYRIVVSVLLGLVATLGIFSSSGWGQSIITTVAGNGQVGFSGDGCPATSAGLPLSIGVAQPSGGCQPVEIAARGTSARPALKAVKGGSIARQPLPDPALRALELGTSRAATCSAGGTA